MDFFFYINSKKDIILEYLTFTKKPKPKQNTKQAKQAKNNQKTYIKRMPVSL